MNEADGVGVNEEDGVGVTDDIGVNEGVGVVNGFVFLQAFLAFLKDSRARRRASLNLVLSRSA